MIGGFIIKKFRCKNGEIVEVEPYNKRSECLFVHYKGEIYCRPFEVIGKTLFPIIEEKKPQKKRKTTNVSNSVKTKNLKTIKIGSSVKIKNCATQEYNIIKICDTHIEQNFKRMSGPYAQSNCETVFIGDAFSVSKNEATISCASPLGKSLIGKAVGQVAEVYLPYNKIEKYKILEIK